MEKEKNWHFFKNSAESDRDYELKDLAQGKTKRHKFKCCLDSDFKKQVGV